MIDLSAKWDVVVGDCVEVMGAMPDNSVDAIVTDPPYGLGFMGKTWDHSVPSVVVWRECLRVLKPGGHLLAFAGTRTQHRMAVNIEDAGFEIRDMIAWVYGSGFPKSLDVSKAIDKAAGAEREQVLVPTKPGNTRGERGISYAGESFSRFTDISKPATDAAKQWDGWGTALKPALEPITVARKPLDGTVAANVLKHGTGALNVDGCRVGTRTANESGWSKTGSKPSENRAMSGANYARDPKDEVGIGRWPANMIHDGSEEVTDLLGDSARFFYCSKASKKDREEGLDAADGTRANSHPTVKPTDLMRYLVRLVTPPGGLVLDPFCGSGSTGKAAVLEGLRFYGCDLDPVSVDVAISRIRWASRQRRYTLFPLDGRKP